MNELILQKAACILIGYLFGCILFAQIVSKTLYRTSLFERGSGNPGMANAGRSLGLKAAVLTLAGDILKTAAAVCLCLYLFPDTGRLAILYCGLGCVLGHDFPFWNHFLGGKGVTSYISTIILYNPLMGIVCSLIGFALVLLKKGLKIPVAVICVLYFGCMCYTQNLQAVVISGILMALMTYKNMKQNRLDLDETDKQSLPSQNSQ